ncbi:MAG TPA: lytic transglycosylase domain-containing protein, partial [Thermoanaerobaculia bacterium]|nr:lytic transglycosylase domain-containing protein [Thermoanaerobaculia bacterium]
LVFVLDSSLTHSAAPAADAPDPDQLAFAQLLAGGGAHAQHSALRAEDLDAALESKQHGFELFRHDSAERAESALLARLPFGRAIAKAAERHRLDPLLLAAVVEVESQFAPRAVSPDGAVGLMQVLPETAQLYGQTELFDPYVNLDVGSQYLAALLERYHGDLALAVAAYNAGPAAVTRFGGVPPYAETRDYVKCVLERYVAHRESAWKTAREDRDLLTSFSTEDGQGRRDTTAKRNRWGLGAGRPRGPLDLGTASMTLAGGAHKAPIVSAR